jgi:hypothetical protein
LSSWTYFPSAAATQINSKEALNRTTSQIFINSWFNRYNRNLNVVTIIVIFTIVTINTNNVLGYNSSRFSLDSPGFVRFRKLLKCAIELALRAQTTRVTARHEKKIFQTNARGIYNSSTTTNGES